MSGALAGLGRHGQPVLAAALLLFVGLYHLPMYLTQLVMAPFIRRLAPAPAPP